VSLSAGNSIGRLNILSDLPIITKVKGKIRIHYQCQCICGKIIYVNKDSLIRTLTKSCGCYRSESTTKRLKSHGRSGTKLWKTWIGINKRCKNRNDKSYLYYGGKGVKICKDWCSSNPNGFSNFLRDMGECPEGMTIDRINSEGDYCKTNCKWSTKKEQSFNTKLNKRNKTGKSGVYFLVKTGKYSAHITNNKLRINLGTYEKFEDAVKARQDAELKYYGKLKGEFKQPMENSI